MTEKDDYYARYDVISENETPATVGFVAKALKVVVQGVREGIREPITKALDKVSNDSTTGHGQLLVLIEGLEKRCAELEARTKKVDLLKRVEALEKFPFEYLGTHETGRSYQKGQFVTHQGSIWAARCTTDQRPGEGGSSWTLAVKRGKDAA